MNVTFAGDRIIIMCQTRGVRYNYSCECFDKSPRKVEKNCSKSNQLVLTRCKQKYI